MGATASTLPDGEPYYFCARTSGGFVALLIAIVVLLKWSLVWGNRPYQIRKLFNGFSFPGILLHLFVLYTYLPLLVFTLYFIYSSIKFTETNAILGVDQRCLAVHAYAFALFHVLAVARAPFAFLDRQDRLKVTSSRILLGLVFIFSLLLHLICVFSSYFPENKSLWVGAFHATGWALIGAAVWNGGFGYKFFRNNSRDGNGKVFSRFERKKLIL